MLRIALTGGIASGKSTVTRRFAEHAVFIIDTDTGARVVVQPGSAGLAKLVQHFGHGFLTLEGKLDRAKLRNHVFSNQAARKELEAILHPLIRRWTQQQLEKLNEDQHAYCIVAIPLLLETQQQDEYDRVLVIDVEESLQLERILARDGGTLEQAAKIVQSQVPRVERLQQADDVIYNNGTISDLNHQVDTLHETYLQLAGYC